MNCGLPLELERTSDFLLLMRLPENLVLIDVLHVTIDIIFGGRVGHQESIMEMSSQHSVPFFQTIEECLGQLRKAAL